MSSDFSTWPRTEKQPGSWEDRNRSRCYRRSRSDFSLWAHHLGSGDLYQAAVFQSKVQAATIQLNMALRYRVLVFAPHRYLTGISGLTSFMGCIWDPEQPQVMRKWSGKEEFSRSWPSYSGSNVTPSETQEKMQTPDFSLWAASVPL